MVSSTTKDHSKPVVNRYAQYEGNAEGTLKEGFTRYVKR